MADQAPRLLHYINLRRNTTDLPILLIRDTSLSRTFVLRLGPKKTQKEKTENSTPVFLWLRTYLIFYTKRDWSILKRVFSAAILRSRLVNLPAESAFTRTLTAWKKMATGVPVNELFERIAQAVSYIPK